MTEEELSEKLNYWFPIFIVLFLATITTALAYAGILLYRIRDSREWVLYAILSLCMGFMTVFAKRLYEGKYEDKEAGTPQ
jgi:hypothetical protein